MNRAARRREGRKQDVTHPVALAIVHPGDVTATFDYSKDRLIVYEIGRTGQVLVQIRERCASGQLVEARNETVAYFLDHTPCEWFWPVDVDMGFPPDALQRLLASADPIERPVVGALCFGLKKHGDRDDTQAQILRCFPTLYYFQELEDEVGFAVMADYPRDALVQVSATGAACFIAHRSVLTEMRERDGDNWFSPVIHPKGPTKFSEDLSFFSRVAAAGFPTFVDTSVKTSHDKGGVFLTEEAWDAQQALSPYGAADARVLPADTAVLSESHA